MDANVKPIVIPFRDTNTQKNTNGEWRFYFYEHYLEVIMEGNSMEEDEELAIEKEVVYDETYVIRKAAIHNIQKGYNNKAQEYFVDISFGAGKFVCPSFGDNVEAQKFAVQIKNWLLDINS